jgi:GMP synthase (glutamine-hydrolysing)
MILVLDNEVDPDYRYLGPEVVHFLDDAEYRVYEAVDAESGLQSADGVVLTGSTASVYDEAHADWVAAQSELVRRCIDAAVPVLGICFGHQLVNQALGGTVELDRRRATFVRMERTADDEILAGVDPLVPVLHSDVVTEPGAGMVPTARTDYSEYFCTRHESAPLWTVQFHPEFTARVSNRPSDWDPGTGSFEACTATRVLENFERVADRRRDTGRDK